MIPKKIHYCWFGRNPLPESARKCIASWRVYLPDYEIIEWNEDNFDVNSIPYTAEAYAAGKYAFVSDYARFKILHDEGGVYFDTDVEVISPLDDILEQGAFMGYEIDPTANRRGVVAPGLGIASEAFHPLYGEILNYYQTLHFRQSDGGLNQTTVGYHVTGLLEEHGLTATPGISVIDGINLYPREYFNPLDDNTGRLKITPETRAIHWYSHSWSDTSKTRKSLSRLLHRCIGVETSSRIKRSLQSILRKVN